MKKKMDYNFNQTTRFSQKAEYYAKYRPKYPEEVISVLKNNHMLFDSMKIVDIGSGTGLLSELFLTSGYNVIGIEPNEDMQTYSEQYLSNYKYIYINGTAEDTRLPTDSMDLIIVGQAFHWFEPTIAKKEFMRILKPEGFVMLAWNRSETENPRYGRFLKKFASDYEQVRGLKDTIDYDAFFSSYEYIQMKNYHTYDFEGYKGLTLSASFMPNELNPEMSIELKEIFYDLCVNGKVTINYITHIYLGRI